MDSPHTFRFVFFICFWLEIGWTANLCVAVQLPPRQADLTLPAPLIDQDSLRLPSVPSPAANEPVVRSADQGFAASSAGVSPGPSPGPDSRESIFSGSGTPGVAANYFSESDRAAHGQLNFNDFPADFLEGLSFQNGAWRAKIGGYVKTDLIRDFRAIDSTDFFDPITIPIGEPQRTSSRFHARQTRLSLDAQRSGENGRPPTRIFVEGDFFGDESSLRLRHAYGEYGNFILGQTWSTLAHRAALPNTLDLTGDVASVSARKAQVRWATPLGNERWTFAVAIEDSPVNVEPQLLNFGEPRRILPDAIARIRYSQEDTQLQLATIVRRLGYQPISGEVLQFNGGGLNATGFKDITPRDRFYGGILWGSGIGSYRELPDLAPLQPDLGTSLGVVAWYAGLHHSWSKRWFTNVTYSQENVDNTNLQPPNSVNRIQYLAINLIHQPTPRIFYGIEGLWGARQNFDRSEQDASRVMVSFGFLLP
jgi:hypothetical protein